jgi:hypothetical protein
MFHADFLPRLKSLAILGFHARLTGMCARVSGVALKPD